MIWRSARDGWQVLLLLAGFLLPVAGVQGLERDNDRGPGTLLADTGDGLERVVISVNSARRSTLRNAEGVTNIVNGLPKTTHILIVTNDRSAFASASGQWPERVRFVELPRDNPITMWTQDPFLVLEGGGDPSAVTLLTSKSFERSGDAAMAGYIADDAGYRVQPSGLYFEGGNIVSDERFILIGANTIRFNALKLGLPEPEVALRFEEELGRAVLVVGPYPQPIAHIDMMITPLGDGRILVADSRAGANLAEAALRNDPGSVGDFERFCEAHFFGHSSISELRGLDGRVIHAPPVQGRTAEMVRASRAIGPVLDGIASALGRHGYRVERIPLLNGGPEFGGKGTDEGEFTAAYPMLTYNNVLIAGQDVYLPRYGWQAMDQAAADTWSSLGFEPHPIDGLTISAMYGGALRCSVKVLERAE